MRSRPDIFSWRVAAVLATAALPAAASAAPSDWIAVPEATLDHMRGGFTSPAQLQVSLGIARLVAVNGEVLARSALTFNGLDGRGAGSMTSPGGMEGSSVVLQIGSANSAQPPFTEIGPGSALDARVGGMPALPAGHPESTGGASGFILQNSLSGQQINSQTTIHVSVNSGALLDAINFHGQLSDALARAAAPQ